MQTHILKSGTKEHKLFYKTSDLFDRSKTQVKERSDECFKNINILLKISATSAAEIYEWLHNSGRKIDELYTIGMVSFKVLMECLFLCDEINFDSGRLIITKIIAEKIIEAPDVEKLLEEF